MYNRIKSDTETQRERENKKSSLIYMYMHLFELIMQKKTVQRLYFIQNIHDNDDLIVHINQGRSRFKSNYVRIEYQKYSIFLIKIDN